VYHIQAVSIFCDWKQAAQLLQRDRATRYSGWNHSLDENYALRRFDNAKHVIYPLYTYFITLMHMYVAGAAIKWQCVIAMRHSAPRAIVHTLSRWWQKVVGSIWRRYWLHRGTTIYTIQVRSIHTRRWYRLYQPVLPSYIPYTFFAFTFFIQCI